MLVTCTSSFFWWIPNGTRGIGELASSLIVGKNEAACAADAAREVVERWLPNG
jgi:hypothetical protein